MHESSDQAQTPEEKTFSVERRHLQQVIAERVRQNRLLSIKTERRERAEKLRKERQEKARLQQEERKKKAFQQRFVDMQRNIGKAESFLRNALELAEGLPRGKKQRHHCLFLGNTLRSLKGIRKSDFELEDTQNTQE